MKPQTLQIKAPKGYEIDEDKSTYAEIVFKPIKPELAQSWEELGKISGWYITANASISRLSDVASDITTRNTFTTKALAESSIAMAQLSQLMAQANDGWEADWGNEKQNKYVIERVVNRIEKGIFCEIYYFLAFKDKATRDTFLETHRELIETYLMIPK